MNNYDLILDKLKESQEFKLITAKDNILDLAIFYLCGSTTNIEDYLYVFDEIENDEELNVELEKKLRSLNDELKNTEDFNVPLTLDIEELCQKIRGFGPSEDAHVSIWREKISINELHLYNTFSFEEVFNQLTNYIFKKEKDIFARIISDYRQNEKEKYNLIQQLEKELIPIIELAENLLTIEEIENNYGSTLQDICQAQAYSNNFHLFEYEKESILLRNSVGLNESEKLALAAFFNEISKELSIL